MAAVEQQVLRALLACLDTGAPLVVPPGASDDLVLRVARHHRISPVIAARVPEAASAALVEELRKDRIATLGRTTLLRHALREALHALTECAVDVVILKGIAYEELAYPAPGTRPATDIDILVLPEAKTRAFDALRGLGYVPVAGAPGYDEPIYHEVTLRRGDVNIDLHIALAPFVRCGIDYRELWEATRPITVEGVKARTLGRAHLLVNHALHMAIHHFDVPALYLVDLARLTLDRPMADAAASVARDWRCHRPWETAAALTADLIPSSRDKLSLSQPATSRIERVIARYGGVEPLPRHEQLIRKVWHFDQLPDLFRYTAVQARRKGRERLLRLFSRRTPEDRLGWHRPSAEGEQPTTPRGAESQAAPEP